MYVEWRETQNDRNGKKEEQFSFDSRAGGKAFIYELKRREQRFLIATWACNEGNIYLGYNVSKGSAPAHLNSTETKLQVF